MLRFFICFLCFLFFQVSGCFAFELGKLHSVLSSVDEKYMGDSNFNSLIDDLCKIIKKHDNTIKLYHSESKVFLFKNNDLIKSFAIVSSQNISNWNTLLNDIIKTSIDISNWDNNKIRTIENEILNSIVANLDTFTRIEKNSSISTTIDYTVNENVLYIKLTSFSKNCAEILKDIVENHPKISGVILDLRDNRGGYFNEAINVADIFLDESIIAYSKEKNQPKKFYMSNSGDAIYGKPLAILTNEFTASSAEIVVAALRDQSRATIIGTKTYGKGSIQQVYTFDDNKLYLTTGYFFSPSGASINNIGIKPQICTGTDGNCLVSDKNDLKKDVSIAINVIKKNLG